MWDDDERYEDEEERDDWNVEDLCQQEFNPDNYYDDAIEAMQYAEPVVVSEEEMEQCLIESALAWTEEMSEEEIAAHNEAADRAYKERLRRQEERLEEDKIYFGKLREEKAKKRELEQQKIAEFAAEREKLTTVHPSNPLAAAAAKNAADCKKNDCFAHECGDKNAEERCDENSKENDVETPVVTEVCLACHVDKSDDVSGASVQELNTDRKENEMVKPESGLTDGNDQDTDSKENNVETSASAEVRSTCQEACAAISETPASVTNEVSPNTNENNAQNNKESDTKSEADSESKEKAEEPVLTEKQQKDFAKKAEREQKKARAKLLNDTVSTIGSNIDAAVQDAYDKRNHKHIKTEEELKAEAEEEARRKAREAEIDAKNAERAKDQESEKKEFPKTPYYKYDCTPDEQAFFELLRSGTQKDDMNIIMAGSKRMAVSAYGMTFEGCRKYHAGQFWVTDLYYTPNTFLLKYDQDGNIIPSNSEKNLHAVKAFGIDVDFRNHKGYAGPHDHKDPLGFYFYIMENLEGKIPRPNAVEYGNCFRMIYVLEEPVYVGSGDAILRMLQALQKYICDVINDFMDVSAEPQPFTSFFRMPGSINSRISAEVHYVIDNGDAYTAQDLCTEFLPPLPMAKEEYEEEVKKILKARRKGENIYRGSHTPYVMFLGRLKALEALIPYIQKGHRELFLHQYGVAYLYTHKGCSLDQFMAAMQLVNSQLQDPLPKGEVRGSFRTLPQHYTEHKFKNETICKRIGIDRKTIRDLGLKGLDYKTKAEKQQEKRERAEIARKNRIARRQAYESKMARLYRRLVWMYLGKQYTRMELCVSLGVTINILERMITNIRKEMKKAQEIDPEYNTTRFAINFSKSMEKIITREESGIDEIIYKDGENKTAELYQAIVEKYKRKPKKKKRQDYWRKKNPYDRDFSAALA